MVSLCSYFIPGSFALPSPPPFYTILSYNLHAWSAHFVLPLLPLYFLGPHRRRYVMNFLLCLYFVASLLLEVKISAPSSLFHVLYSCARISLPPPPSPCCGPVYLCTRTHPTSTAFSSSLFLSLPYRFGTNSSLSTEMYTRVYILLFRPRFLVEYATCCTYSMFVPLSYTGLLIRRSGYQFFKACFRLPVPVTHSITY